MEDIASIAYFGAARLQALIDKITFVMVACLKGASGEVVSLDILVGLRI